MSSKNTFSLLAFSDDEESDIEEGEVQETPLQRAAAAFALAWGKGSKTPWGDWCSDD